MARPVELVDGGAEQHPGERALTRLDQPFLELAPEAVAQLGAGLLGEGDRRDRRELGFAPLDELDHPPDERGRLARPGSGFDEQRRCEVVAHLVPGRLVRRVGFGGHATSSGSGSAISSR